MEVMARKEEWVGNGERANKRLADGSPIGAAPWASLNAGAHSN
jgi:hypothetical protein